MTIYLDTFAINSLAKGDASLRQRFVAVLNSGADLLFSIANAVEITGAQGSSSDRVKAFLNQLGPNWYPIEMLPSVVIHREGAGLPPSQCCFAEELLVAYFQNRTCEHVAGTGRVIELSEDFFQLGQFVEWLSPQRDNFLTHSRRIDQLLKDNVPLLRAKHKQNHGWLDRELPQPHFNAVRRATYAYNSLMRNLVFDGGYQVRNGDGMDLCHAVMATAFATIAALDKQWKHRVESIPKPNEIPHIFYGPELGANGG